MNRNIGLRSILLCALGVLVFASSASSVSAQSRSRKIMAEKPRQLRVSFRDLDLSGADGHKMLSSRVWAAVKTELCPMRHEPMTDAEVSQVMACRRQAMADAKPQIAAALDRSRQMAAAQTVTSPLAQ